MLLLAPRHICRIAFALVLISSALKHVPEALAVSWSVSQAVPETNLPDADAAIEKGKAADAIPIYLKALSADPTNPALNAALAEAYLDEEKSFALLMRLLRPYNKTWPRRPPYPPPSTPPL
jgi:predicted Zn-dependent protease